MARFTRIERDPLRWAQALADSYRRRQTEGYKIHRYMDAMIALSDHQAKHQRALERITGHEPADKFHDGDELRAIAREALGE